MAAASTINRLRIAFDASVLNSRFLATTRRGHMLTIRSRRLIGSRRHRHLYPSGQEALADVLADAVFNPGVDVIFGFLGDAARERVERMEATRIDG